MNAPSSRAGSAVTCWLPLVCCVLAAFAVRALPWRNFIAADGQYLFYGPDAYDHLRRITLGLASFPRVPLFDSYYGYPVGTGQIWSPLFDYLLTLVTLLFGGGRETAMTVGFWLSPLLAAVTVLQVWRAGNRLFGAPAGLAAALVLALLPAHIYYTFVSELDHHVAEPMVCILLLVSLLRGEEAVARGRGWLATGFWLVVALLVWRGAVLFWGIAVAALVLQGGADLLHGRNPAPVASFGRRSCLAAAAGLAPLCAFNSLGTSGSVNFGIVSWFHVILLAAGALFFLALERAGSLRRLAAWTAAATGVTLLLAVLLPLGRAFFRQLATGFTVILGGDPWLDMMSELRSLIFPHGTLALGHATETLSLLYWLFPLLLVPAFGRWRREGFRELRYPLFLAWGAFFWILPILRERYVHLTAVVLALGAGFLLVLAAERIAPPSRGRLVGIVLLVLLLSPIAPFLVKVPRLALPDAERYDLQPALAWLRDNTPRTSFYDQPLQVPEYGVMADWILGAYVDFVAQRPTVATDFGWETHGLYESAAFFTLSDAAAAGEILRRNRVRYLFLNDVSGALPQLRAISEAGVQRGKLAGLRLPPFEPLRSMFYRLFIQNGAAFEVGEIASPALGGYRLLYQSRGGFFDPVVGFVSHYKIFEVVAGAVLRGSALPGERLTLSLRLRDADGRVVEYRDSVTADGEGTFAFLIPYPTDAPSGTLVPEGVYQIAAGTARFAATASERDILSGAVLKPRPSPKG